MTKQQADLGDEFRRNRLWRIKKSVREIAGEKRLQNYVYAVSKFGEDSKISLDRRG